MKNGYKEEMVEQIRIKSHRDVLGTKDGTLLEVFCLLLITNCLKMFVASKLNLIKLTQLLNILDFLNFLIRDMHILIVVWQLHIAAFSILFVKRDKLE